jgi:hypothetical protein
VKHFLYLLFKVILQLKSNPFCTFSSISVNNFMPSQQFKYSLFLPIYGIGAEKQQNAFCTCWLLPPISYLKTVKPL